MIIPALLGILAAVLAWQYIDKREKELGFQAEPLPVLVALKNIPRMTRLDETVVEVRQIPRAYVQPGALTRIEDALKQVNTVPILQGEQVLGTKLVSFGVETGLALKITTGFRAVTLAVDDISGVAGLIRPGNYVDVLGTFDFGDKVKSDQRTFTLLQDAQVLAVQQNLGPESEAMKAKTMAEREGGDEGLVAMPGTPVVSSGSSKSNITLALSPIDAQKVVLAQESGRVSVVLRSLYEEHQAYRIPSLGIAELLGVKEKVIYRPAPQWREIRGTAVGQ